MDIKSIVNELVNKIAKKEVSSFTPESYTIANIYDAEKLVVGKFEYNSSDVTEFGPMVKKTSQNYIFDSIVINEKVKYQEVFITQI